MRNILLFFLTIMAISASGQNHFLGVKGGVGWTKVTASNFPKDRNARTGLAIGLTYDYLFKKHFSAGTGIMYNQRGFTNDFIFTDASGNPTGRREILKYYYDYFTVPVKVGFNYGKTVYGFANIGITPSIIGGDKIITPIFDLDGTLLPGETTTVTGRVNKFDIGGLVEIGGGYKVKGRYWLFTSFSYQHSFTTITNSDYFTYSTIRHYSMTLNLGLTCALTKE